MRVITASRVDNMATIAIHLAAGLGAMSSPKTTLTEARIAMKEEAARKARQRRDESLASADGPDLERKYSTGALWKVALKSRTEKTKAAHVAK